MAFAIRIRRRLDNGVVDEEWAVEDPREPWDIKLFPTRREAESVAGVWRAATRGKIEYTVVGVP